MTKFFKTIQNLAVYSCKNKTCKSRLEKNMFIGACATTMWDFYLTTLRKTKKQQRARFFTIFHPKVYNIPPTFYNIPPKTFRYSTKILRYSTKILQYSSKFLKIFHQKFTIFQHHFTIFHQKLRYSSNFYDIPPKVYDIPPTFTIFLSIFRFPYEILPICSYGPP